LQTTVSVPKPPTSSVPASSWTSKVYNGILGALGGQYDTTYIPTPGGVVQQQVANTPGQQWKRIIAGAVAGFGGAAAAGTQGPGGTMRGLGAGIQAGFGQRVAQDQRAEAQANTQFEQQQKAAMNNAQQAMLSQQVAESQWRVQHGQHEVESEDIANFNASQKLIADSPGATKVADGLDYQDAIKLTQDNPALHDDLANGRLVIMRDISSGKNNGVQVWKVTPSFMDSKTPTDLTVHIPWYPEGHQEQVIPAGEPNKNVSQLLQQIDTYTNNQTLQKQKQDAENERLKNEQTRVNLERQRLNLETPKIRAETELAENKAAQTTAVNSPQGQSLVDAIGQGRATVGTLRSAMNNPSLLEAVTAKYPDWDQSKVAGYAGTMKDFTSGHTSIQLNNAGTALLHLQELQRLNTAQALLPLTSAKSAYQNQLSTVVHELDQFYGANNIPAAEDLKSTLSAPTTWQRDAAIKRQAVSMGEKLDQFGQQWRNAAPSAAYEARMPDISAESKVARANLDPRFAATLPAPGSAGTISLANVRGQPEFRGMSDAQIIAAARLKGYAVQ